MTCKFLRLIALSVCLVLTVFCCSGALGDDGPSQVVIWVRNANDLEMRLSPETAPALRNLARNGVSLPQLASMTAGEVAAALSPLRAALGKGGYREVGGARDEGGASSRLAAKFGEPPPVSEEEKEILRRLREASGGKAPEPKSAPAEPDAPPGAREATGAERAQAVIEGLKEGARLVVAVDSEPAGAGAETEARDRDLATIVREGELEGKADSRRAILVILIPPAGRPAMVAAGAGLKKGRVSRREPGAEELAAAVARLLGLSEATPGSGNWFAEACLEAPPAGGRS